MTQLLLEHSWRSHYIIYVSCFWRPNNFFVNSLVDLDIDTPQTLVVVVVVVVVVVDFFVFLVLFCFVFFYAVFCLYFILRYQNRDYVRRHKSVSSPTQSFSPTCWALVKMSSEKGLKLFHSKENKLFSLLQLLWTTLRKWKWRKSTTKRLPK